MNPPHTVTVTRWGKAATGTRCLRRNLPDFIVTAKLATGLAGTKQLVSAKWFEVNKGLA